MKFPVLIPMPRLMVISFLLSFGSMAFISLLIAGMQTAAWLQLANVYEAQGRNSDAQNIRQRYGRGSG